MCYRIGIKGIGGLKMETLVINNTVDKTQILPKVSQPTETTPDKSNRINGWIIGEKMNTNSSEAELYYVTNSQTAKKALLKVYRSNHTVNLAVFEKIKNIKNPHVVKIYDYGIQDDKQFVIEELLEGDSLDKTTVPLSKKHLWKLVHDINSGLGAIHNFGIIHRDLKPSNIICCNGRYVITDFGISIFTKERSADYSHTAGYNAPELFLNEYTTSYDYYGFGFILYYAATGINPFENRGKEFIYRDEIENFTVKDFLSRKEVLALPERFQKLLQGLIAKVFECRWGFWDVLKWLLFFIPVNKKQKPCCKLDFDYQIHTKKELVEALYNSPEVFVKPLKEEDISLYEFLKSVNLFKAKRIYRKIHTLKSNSQKQFINWIYDPYFDIKLINIVRKFF